MTYANSTYRSTKKHFMKPKLIIIMLVFLVPVFAGAQCDDLDQMVRDYQTENYKSKAGQAATKAILTQILKQVIGKAAGVVTGVLTPTMIGTPYDAFINSLKRINNIASQQNIDWNKYTKELEQLKSEANGVKIEKIFGNNQKCYNNLDYIVSTFEAIKSRSQTLLP